jgi:hypothetical protein
MPINRFISPDANNADAAVVQLGIAAPNPAPACIGATPAQLLLELWAVQMALTRRRGGKRLDDREYETIRRCTREPPAVAWSRGTGE